MQASFGRRKQSNKWPNEQCDGFFSVGNKKEKGRKTQANIL